MIAVDGTRRSVVEVVVCPDPRGSLFVRSPRLGLIDLLLFLTVLALSLSLFPFDLGSCVNN